MSTTPKIHIILDHLYSYFDDNKITLKTTSDELRGGLKKNSTKLRLWLNKGGEVRCQRIFLYENKYCRLRHFSVEGGGVQAIFLG